MKIYLLILTLIIGISSTSICQEMKNQKIQVPAAILKVFKTSYPKGKIQGVSIKTEKGNDYYEIESHEGKIIRHILYTKDCAVSQIKEMIPADQLPQGIANALSKNRSNGNIKSVEKDIQDSVISYDIVLQNGTRRMNLVFSADGSILNNR